MAYRNIASMSAEVEALESKESVDVVFGKISSATFSDPLFLFEALSTKLSCLLICKEKFVVR